MKFFWRMIASAWMPFAVFMACLLSRIVLDVLAVFSPVTMANVTMDVFVIEACVFFVGALAIGLSVVLFFLVRGRWRQGLKRVVLLCSGFAIWFYGGRIWIDYARDHLHPSIEIQIIGEHLARIGDVDVAESEKLESFVHGLVRQVGLRKVVFASEKDIECGIFWERFLYPCEQAGIRSFAFRVSDGEYPIAGDESFSYCFIPSRIAAVMVAADGKLGFEATYKGAFKPNDTGAGQSTGRFADSEEAVFGEGRACVPAVVLVASKCQLSVVQNVVRRLALSGYREIFFLRLCQ